MAFNTQRLQFAGPFRCNPGRPPRPAQRALYAPTHCLPIASPAPRIWRQRAALQRSLRAKVSLSCASISLAWDRAKANLPRQISLRMLPTCFRRPTIYANIIRHPSLLIGHSLGGAAVLAVAKDIPEVRAVATIGAPADVGHVLKNFGTSLEEIEKQGAAEVDLAGRKFLVRKQFVEDARAQSHQRRCRIPEKATSHPSLTAGPDGRNRECYRNLPCGQTSQKLCFAGQGRPPAHQP